MTVLPTRPVGGVLTQGDGRVPSGTGLSSATEPASSLGPSGFDPSRMMQEFYLSRYYEPKAERPADNVQAAIEFAIDRYFLPRIEAVRRVIEYGYERHGVNPLKNGEKCEHGRYEWEDCTGCYDEALLVALFRDSDGGPEGRDAQRLDGEAATARAEGIAQPTEKSERNP